MKTENETEYLWETQSRLEEAVDQLQRSIANLEALEEFIEYTVNGLGTPDDTTLLQSASSIRKSREDLSVINSNFKGKVQEFRTNLLSEEEKSNG